MKTIINPLDNKRYSLFSKQGKQILKSYVNKYNSGGAIQEQQEFNLDNLTQQQIEYLEANNIDIDIDFFNKSLPGVPMESLVENQCIDQMLSFWDWVIENINKASSING